ncbi:Niemann-Pick C2 protein [Mytilus galloprovincialis]|uniref:Niemann-Pick C2 protein n=1 Tax=Mytilus galloprovincialis TaxID=29158 RepID=A0A8B6HRS6_MYTGA|nr:Niemann-Pick C2 protein [Mytilus galloprovincialis]
MKVILLVLFVFESTKKSYGLKQNVLEHDIYPSNTVFLDGVGVGSSANEQNSHILFANTEKRTTPITADTTLQTLTSTTRPTTKVTSIATSEVTTFPTEIITRQTTTDTTVLSSERTALHVSTTFGATLSSTVKTFLTTTEKNTLPPTTKLRLLTTGKVTMQPTDTAMTTIEKTSLQTTQDTTLPITEPTVVSTTPVVNTTPLSAVFRECGSSGSHIKSGRINSVTIQCSGFNSRRFCLLKRNTTARVFVNFTSNVDTTKVKTIVHGILPGSPQFFFLHLLSNDGEEGVRYNAVTEDACVENVDHCNIKAGEAVQYINAAAINRFFPLIRLTIKLEIRDDQDRNLVCIRFPAEIVN